MDRQKQQRMWGGKHGPEAKCKHLCSFKPINCKALRQCPLADVPTHNSSFIYASLICSPPPPSLEFFYTHCTSHYASLASLCPLLCIFFMYIMEIYNKKDCLIVCFLFLCYLLTDLPSLCLLDFLSTSPAHTSLHRPLSHTCTHTHTHKDKMLN